MMVVNPIGFPFPWLSLSVSGEHHVTCHNMGMSYFYLGKLREAKDCFERSLELDEVS